MKKADAFFMDSRVGLSIAAADVVFGRWVKTHPTTDTYTFPAILYVKSLL